MQLLDETVYNTSELEAQQAEIAAQMEETVALINQLITTCATTVHAPDDYDLRYHQLDMRYQQQEEAHQDISEHITDLHRRRAQAKEMHDYLATQPPLEYSDDA